MLEKEGFLLKEGPIIDATIEEAPKQRDSREENDQIKQGEIPDGWENKPNMLRQKDTDASVHDSQAVEDLIDQNNSHYELFADSAYSGGKIATLLEKKKIRNRIHEKGYSNTPLTEAQWERNRKNSKIRARVEHVFAYMTNSMKRIYIRTIGKKRANGVIGLMNLTYNMNRYMQLAW